MKKRRRQIFACVLALSMFFQQFTIQTYADDITQDSTPITENVTEEDESTSKDGETLNEDSNSVTESSEEQENPQQETTDQEADKTSTQENKDEANQVEVQADENSSETVAKLAAVKLVEKDGSVFGNGIITGSEDLDKDMSWNGSEETRGYDNSSSNNVIRSFDSIKYNVSSTINMDKKAHTLVYEITLPKDSEITLDQLENASVTKVDNGSTITYTCKFVLQQGYAGGEREDSFIIRVGNKKQNDVICPSIKAYLDEDKDNYLEVQNVKDVIVTSAPMYNIVLAKKSGETITRDVYDFSNSVYKENAKTYANYKVNGYKCTFGVALELRRPGSGIKGVEFPDSSKDFTFDIDLSDAKLNGKSLAENGFVPLLYAVNDNTPGGEGVVNIPFTSKIKNEEEKGCLNSGTFTMSQDGTTLHVTVKGFKLDAKEFPKSNYAKDSYWEDINKIREGIFSAFQFQVVYPYINQDGKNLEDVLKGGSVNANVTVKNMQAISETGTMTRNETNLNDNSQGNTWDLESGTKRNQQIFYSSRENMINPYSPGAIWNDEDIAAVGANDLAFTVKYIEGKLGEAYPIENMPVAIDQFVLFDRSAIEDVTYNNTYQKKAGGYNVSIRYAVRKEGRMDNDSMRTAKLSDFDFFDTKPEGGCDAVLVQYRGTNLGNSELDLRTQFTAKVKPNADLADHVYMVTAFTNSWTANDFKDEIENSTRKELKDVTRDELSAWAKEYGTNSEKAADFVKNKEHSLSTIDYRNIYTVPNYVNGVYLNDTSTHKSSVYYADALYIVPYTTTVTKTVAQLDENGNPMQIYDIGKEQNIVDYKISSSLKYWGNVKPSEGSTTTVYLEDKIPDGLSYVKGSAYWGGNYTSKFPDQGQINGGQQIEPEISEDGKVLKWSIPNVALVNGALPSLYYSCKIDKDVKDNVNLKNEVTINTTEDQRPIYKENDNISTAGISVTRSKEYYIVKRGGGSLELQDSSYYELVAANTSSEDKKDLYIFDTMPYKNDSKSTQINGKYKITSLTMDAKDVKHASDMEVWYTNSLEYIGKTAKDIDPSDVTDENGWKKAAASGFEKDTITFTGDELIGSWPTVIAYKDANLESNTTARLRLNYEAVAGAENDDFINSWTTMSNKKDLNNS